MARETENLTDAEERETLDGTEEQPGTGSGADEYVGSAPDDEDGETIPPTEEQAGEAGGQGAEGGESAGQEQEHAADIPQYQLERAQALDISEADIQRFSKAGVLDEMLWRLERAGAAKAGEQKTKPDKDQAREPLFKPFTLPDEEKEKWDEDMLALIDRQNQHWQEQMQNLLGDKLPLLNQLAEQQQQSQTQRRLMDAMAAFDATLNTVVDEIPDMEGVLGKGDAQSLKDNSGAFQKRATLFDDVQKLVMSAMQAGREPDVAAITRLVLSEKLPKELDAAMKTRTATAARSREKQILGRGRGRGPAGLTPEERAVQKFNSKLKEFGVTPDADIEEDRF